MSRLRQSSGDDYPEAARKAPADLDSPDEFWTLDDLESRDAPHVPVVLPYVERLATFRKLDEVAEPVLFGEPYRRLVGRLRDTTGRFGGRAK